MSTETKITCDICGKTVYSSPPESSLTYRIYDYWSVNRAGNNTSFSISTSVCYAPEPSQWHFCSLACMRKWLKGKLPKKVKPCPS